MSLKGIILVQEPLLVTTPLKKYPNFKVKKIFKCINYICLQVGNVEKFIAGDDQTSSFKEQYSDKIKIKFKNAGNIFQSGALCDAGYTLCFYFSINLLQTST